MEGIMWNNNIAGRGYSFVPSLLSELLLLIPG